MNKKGNSRTSNLFIICLMEKWKINIFAWDKNYSVALSKTHPEEWDKNYSVALPKTHPEECVG